MLSASLVIYNTKQSYIQRLIELVIISPIKKLYIIDNSTTTESQKFIPDLPQFKYIKTAYNLGYGKAHNLGIKESLREGFKYHIILNPDIYWKGDVISPLIEFMEQHSDTGQLMPKILYPSGEIQYLCKLLPSPFDLLIRRFLPFQRIIENNNKKYEMHWTGYNKIMEVPVLSGCFMVLRNSILKEIGIFDERFFIYGEDVDLCRRIGQVSKTIFYPEVSIYHLYERGSYHNKKLLFLHIKSIIKYFNKWGWFFDSTRRKRNKEIKKNNLKRFNQEIIGNSKKQALHQQKIENDIKSDHINSFLFIS